MEKTNKALLHNFIKELKPSKRKDNRAFVYVLYDDNMEGFLYVATFHVVARIRLKNYEAVKMIEEGLKLSFQKADDMEAPHQGKILSGYYKREREGIEGFQESTAEALPDIKVIKNFFFGQEALIELKDSRKIQLSRNEEFLRMFEVVEEGVNHDYIYIKNDIFEGVDMSIYKLYGKKEAPHLRPMILKDESQFFPEYIITPVRYYK